MNLSNKFCLGTVQFGQKYGFFNKKKITDIEIKKIFKSINQEKIKFLDTALSYGESQIKVGKFKKKNFKIVSKLIFDKDIKLIDKDFEKLLKQLKSNNIYALLVHNPDVLLTKKSKLIFNYLNGLKKKKLIRKFGVSVYDPTTLNKILKKFKIDIVQFPGNVLDKRFLNKNKLKYYKSLKIELHVRSIFLQGVLVNHDIPTSLKRFSKILKKYSNYLIRNKIEPIDFCISFIKQYKEIDKYIFGVNSLRELEQIINFKSINIKYLRRNFSFNNKNLIDPRRW